MRYLIDLVLIVGAVAALQAATRARWQRRLRQARRLEREARSRLHDVRVSEMALTAMISPLEAPRRVHPN